MLDNFPIQVFDTTNDGDGINQKTLGLMLTNDAKLLQQAGEMYPEITNILKNVVLIWRLIGWLVRW